MIHVMLHQKHRQNILNNYIHQHNNQIVRDNENLLMLMVMIVVVMIAMIEIDHIKPFVLVILTLWEKTRANKKMKKRKTISFLLFETGKHRGKHR